MIVNMSRKKVLENQDPSQNMISPKIELQIFAKNTKIINFE